MRRSRMRQNGLRHYFLKKLRHYSRKIASRQFEETPHPEVLGGVFADGAHSPSCEPDRNSRQIEETRWGQFEETPAD
jgi:hypothetical protein